MPAADEPAAFAPDELTNSTRDNAAAGQGDQAPLTEGADDDLTASADADSGAEGEGGEPEGLTADESEDLVTAEPDSPPVTYSGQDFDVAGLVHRLNRNDILVPIFGHNDDRITSAGFQRSFVWNRPQMDRFIESLLLGYPIPGIFLIRQVDRRYLVLDGQQRLRTLQHFYSGIYDGKEFALRNVSERLRGLTYRTLDGEQRRLIDDAFIQATIVSSDGSVQALDSIYKIFERLNAGGTQLTAHEIRVALFAGPFIDFLDRLNSDVAWRALYGKRSPRVRDQELVLRIVALYLNAASYRRPLKSFLNAFAQANRDMTSLGADTLADRFGTAVLMVAGTAGRDGIRFQSAQINSALAEAIIVGLMRRLDQRTSPDPERIAEAIASLKANPALQDAITRATADEENVRARLEIATAAFAGI
ncbi:DUF262 domain-containing protein [Cellulomonas sp. JH27-2]|uniref:DUF262 domain-containing protein n=1 Tax=Cellulomonas sp. JH27-2 TaxID=2774139 RepID=UPI00177BF96A|nr:DUF262 domain-containing protein [Cellulomonas sp. JH27-2]MBD8059967.1 DUF262 domain-containing protein [Cellulomonas sp. JH27-2]